MKTIPLNNGLEIPQIGVDTWTLRGETARKNVCLALKAGFRHIDTAQGYENETEVGQGIIDSGVPRQEIFLTTKVATNIMREGREAVRKSIDESLTKLKTDYIDLLLIHWPVKDCVKDTWQVMEDYVRQGKVKSIGSFAPKLKLLGEHTDPKTIHGRDIEYAGIEFIPSKEFIKEGGKNREGYRKSEAQVGNSQMYDEKAMDEALRRCMRLGYATIPEFMIFSGLKRDSAKAYLDSLCKGEHPRLWKVRESRRWLYFPKKNSSTE